LRRIFHTVADASDDAILRTVGRLFVHEQMHVLERCYPKRFARLHEDVFGFRHATVRPHPWITERQMSNPDGLDEGWVIADPRANAAKGGHLWLRTLLADGRDVPRMGRDFRGAAIALRERDGAFDVVEDGDGAPSTTPMEQLREHLERYPIPRGHDHPNEVAAYLFERIFVADCVEPAGRSQPPSPAQELVDEFREWCRRRLR